MNPRTSLWVILMMLTFPAVAQQRDVQSNMSLLDWFAQWRTRTLVSGMDSGYIDIPKLPWLVSLNFDLRRDHFGLIIPNALNIGTGKAHFYSNFYGKPTVGAYYRGWGLALGRGLSSRPETHFTFTSYGQKIGFDFNYEQVGYMKCDFSISDIERRELLLREQLIVDREDAAFVMVNVNAYYVFNSRRFSYGSALSQASMQQQSAGSFLAGASYFQTTMDFGGSTLAQYLMADRAELTTRQIALAFGHGYNFVPESDKRFLLHGSLLAGMLIPVYNSVHFTPMNQNSSNWDESARQYFIARRMDLENYSTDYRISVVILFRGAAYWNISPRLVTGITWLVTAYPALRRAVVDTYGVSWGIFPYFGYRF